MNNFKSAVFKALGDPSRLKILALLRAGEKCACEITPIVGFSQPTTSGHLKVLNDCGILKRRKEGNRVVYSISTPEIYDLIDLVDSEFVRSLGRSAVAQAQRANWQRARLAVTGKSDS